MTLHLPDGKHITISSHSGKIWITVYNGCGATVALSKKEAVRVRKALFDCLYDDAIKGAS